MSQSLFEGIRSFDQISLSHVEPVVKQVIDIEEVRRVNPALAQFYLENLAPKQPPTEVAFRVFNIAKPKDQETYKWELIVKPVDDAHLPLIRSVVFDLHPTFCPSSVEVTQPPFSLSRVGWGVFEIGITVHDIRGTTHRFSHKLSFVKANEHRETIFVAPAQQNVAASPAAEPASSSSLPRMSGVSEQLMHGALGAEKGWSAPFLVTFCDELARPEYSSVKAHEYNEDPMTLRAKIKVLANLIRQSKNFLAYTGAGLSTSSGIDDYASRSKNSVATGSSAVRPVKRGLDAEPSFGHFTLAALSRAGHLKHWVQQNHDGLPQKAGFPQGQINEIHGAWFDPSNPVVPMSGSLRGDLFKWMLEIEEKSDLVIALGTSLSGMNADRMVSTPSKKFLKNGIGLGSVIVGYQQTKMDKYASLRIFAKIDEVMLLLANELGIEVPLALYTPNIPEKAKTKNPHAFKVPYNLVGKRSKSTTTVWNLSVGQKVKLTAGPGKGFEGKIVGVPKRADDHYTVELPCTREGPKLGVGKGRYCLGSWWVESACKGEVPLLPCINI
mmetsp:Transcript_29405/g.40627  ORF Transcript_29405/g.40627 Transcript_29405/m.40627 type:complete len:553 (+) Transcript_29405:96-1754(+)|eukprot:CAMPEP_0201492466 /NCGR_PEP_ID=MMETSP0151_2-20130828/33243_1 /ASSEMBLY_ACC=CAM_ASM_000257 /TAXON_ID=200890 /ORGANISM="Paramoeba atlantica, Strain 621/1 / CCAP 1560/9" /LENGTH=552 /DNA_ID=CAMNT_0047879291 /DNA_START=87 /DNA_END=1745 /DNA_ORIENTATION=+